MDKKITMQLANSESRERITRPSPSVYGKDKVAKFLKSNASSKAKISREINRVRTEADNTYKEEPTPIPQDPTPAIEEIPKTEIKEKRNIFKSIGSFFSRNKSKAMMGLGLVTLASSTNAEIGSSADKEFVNNKKTKEYPIKTDPGGGERKVKEVPPGYVKSHTEGNKTYYKKLIGGSSRELKQAKPGDGKENEKYEKTIKNLLKSHSPEELAEKGYISSKAIEKYKQYYTQPQEDVVYIEPEETKVEDPFSAYAKVGESLWSPNRHLIGILSAPIRETQSITNPGNINTSNSEHMVLVRLVDNMGNPTGECVEIKTGDVQKYFGTTMTLQSDELAKELNKMAKKSKTYTATAEDFAKNQ